MKKKVLIVEDDPAMAQLLSEVAAELPVEIEHHHEGESGLERALNGPFSLVILDIGLPKLDGFEVCKALRAQKPDVAILIISSRSLELDKVLALEFGADDYVVKPFGTRELLSRMKALLRRADRTPGAQSRIVIDDLDIDLEKRQVLVGGAPVELTALEFDILTFLASHPGRPITREELMQHVWGYEASDFGPTITAQISRLRAKLEPDVDNPRYIMTVRGVGYRLGR